MNGRVVHFEIPTDDAKRASSFYSEAFGWRINEIPEMRYTVVGTTPSDEKGMPLDTGAINGGMMPRQDGFAGPVITIAVEDIDSTLVEVARLGGKKARDKMQVGDMGFAAYFTDTEGNTIGLWQNAAGG